MTNTLIEQTTDHSTIEMDESGSQRFSHYVRCPEEYPNVIAYLTEAAIEGFEVTALCGYTWVPLRDPKKFPICKACIELALSDLVGA